MKGKSKDPLSGKRFYIVQDGTIPPQKIAEFFKGIKVPNQYLYDFGTKPNPFCPKGMVYCTKYEPLRDEICSGLFVSAVFKADERHIKDFNKYQRLVYDEKGEIFLISKE